MAISFCIYFFTFCVTYYAFVCLQGFPAAVKMAISGKGKWSPMGEKCNVGEGCEAFGMCWTSQGTREVEITAPK